jgi:hypothetical protein
MALHSFGSSSFIVLFIFLISLFIFLPVMPVEGQGQQFVNDTAPYGIVPCGDEDEPACNICYLGSLAQESLNFAVYFTVFVATLLFVFAGFKYITAGGDTGKISDATSIFGKVIVGLIIVLVAWLVVDTIMKAFFAASDLNIQQEPAWGPWNDLCPLGDEIYNDEAIFSGADESEVDITNMMSGREDPRIFAELPDDYLIDTRSAALKVEEEQLLRETLADLCGSDDHCSIQVNKGNCDPNESYQVHTGGCTDISRLNSGTFQLIENAAHECGAAEFERTRGIGESMCTVLVTGGSELGHSSQNGCAADKTTHCSGNKVDISKRVGALNRYVGNNTYFEVGTCPDGRSGRVHKENGSCWADEGDHWDVMRGF